MFYLSNVANANGGRGPRLGGPSVMEKLPSSCRLTDAADNQGDEGDDGADARGSEGGSMLCILDIDIGS